MELKTKYLNLSMTVDNGAILFIVASYAAVFLMGMII